MKISPITFQNCSKSLIQKQNNNRKILKDNLNFGNFFNQDPDNIRLYRCIGRNEYEKLLKRESIKSSGYATLSPMGWRAKGWNDGFVPMGAYSDCYFITFKTNRFKNITDEREDKNDTRYKIAEEYSLDDIENIRKGYNTHGELVWTQNFDEEKAKDVQEKVQTIMYLVSLLKCGNLRFDRNKITDELLSYRREFPNLVNI